jgi:Zn-dependent protease
MPARSALTLFRFRGIRIGVDYSWFIVLFLVILSLSGFYRDVLGVDRDAMEPYVLAVVSALAFFGSILLHELGHAVVALRRGIGITDITLWLFGGIARLSRDSDSAGTEFKIAVAGPLVTLGIVIACLGGGFAIAGDGFVDAMLLDEATDASGAIAVLAWLATINTLVLVFNLIPAYPLDGGRIARAIAWRITGDRNRATRFAALLGQGFSYVFIGLGVFLAIQGSLITGVWLVLIGVMLGSAARGAVLQTEVNQRIEGITVADVMDPEPVAIPESASVERALDEFFLRYQWPWFPVVDAAERFSGLLQRGAADAVPEGRRDTATVSELVTADRDGALRVGLDAPIEALLGNENLRRLGGLAAVDTDGRLRGVVTAEQVGRALRNALAEG